MNKYILILETEEIFQKTLENNKVLLTVKKKRFPENQNESI